MPNSLPADTGYFVIYLLKFQFIGGKITFQVQQVKNTSTG